MIWLFKPLDVASQTRAAVLTAAQCATYDEVKQAWMRLTGWGDAFPTHLASSLATGLVTTTITSPVDVIKTHMFMGESQLSSARHLAHHGCHCQKRLLGASVLLPEAFRHCQQQQPGMSLHIC